jgi:threonine/homoserine/homoserine lactone efflux protein
MNQESTVAGNAKSMRRRRKGILLAVGFSLVVALVCFVVVAFLPTSKEPHFKDPWRSFLTGLGVIGVASPLCIAGFSLRKRFAPSPYYEGKFIATVLSVFGLVCVAAGLACIILGAYDLVTRFLNS